MTYGFEVVCRALERVGVRHVFGVPGTSSVDLYEGLRRSRLRTILTTSELAGAFAAGAYGRVSGRPGTLVTIAGPGFAYALPGLAEARLDSAPLVHLALTPERRGRAFDLQDIDQGAMAGPVVKRVIAIERVAEIQERIREAYALAAADEPGPVLIQISAPALTGRGVFPEAPAVSQGAGATAPNDEVAARAYALLAGSQRPVMLVGQGAVAAAEAVRSLAERATMPVLSTPSGRGVLAEDHPLALGFDVSRGDVQAVNALLADADAVLVLGAKLGHNGSVGFGLELPPGQTVRVDASADVLAANGQPITVCADAGCFLAGLEQVTLGGGWTMAALASWRRRILSRSNEGLPEPRFRASGGAAGLFAAIREALPRSGILVTDSGLHQMLARRHFNAFAPHGLLIPSDFQSMGFGIPAAVGAKIAVPERPVIAVVGDGGLRMTGFEILTAVRERLALPIVVFNDERLNLIRLQQLAQWGHAVDVDLGSLDLSALAASLGASYTLVEQTPGRAVVEALAGERPTILEVRVDDSPAIHALGAVRRAKESLKRVVGRPR